MHATIIILFLCLLSLHAQNEQHADSLFRSAKHALANHRCSEAKTILLDLYAGATPDVEHPENRGEMARQLGHYYIHVDDADSVKHWFERAVEHEPENSEFVHWLGRANVMLGLRSNIFKRAFYAVRIKRLFHRAIELDSLNTVARHDLLLFYKQVPRILGGSGSKAMEQAQILAEINPWEGFKARAELHRLDNDETQRSQEFAEAVKTYPNDWQFWRGYLESVSSSEHSQSMDSLIHVAVEATGADSLQIRRFELHHRIAHQNWEQSELLLDQLIKEFPKDYDLSLTYAEVALQAERRLEKAILLLNESYERLDCPVEQIEVNVLRCDILIHLRELDQAGQVAIELKRLEPKGDRAPAFMRRIAEIRALINN